MGLILSRFYDKPSTRDTLEKIEQEIQNIEERRWDKIRREQFVVQILSFLPLTILAANFIVFIYPTETSWRDKFILSLPVALLNLLLYLSRKTVQWYSRWSLDKEEVRMRKLQKQKKKILEMVCETESYRVATELLEKYDPRQLRRRDKGSDRPTSPVSSPLSKTTTSVARTPQSKLQVQHIQSQYQHQPSLLLNTSLQPSHNLSTTFSHSILNPPALPPPTPTSKPLTQPQHNTVGSNPHNISLNATVAASSVQGRPVRPILSKDRGLLEKFVDWVVADGPDNRFALICRFCYGHNGMSLAEEFETINFRCCYCYNLNTAINKHTQKKDQLQPDRIKSAENGSRSEKPDPKLSTSKMRIPGSFDDAEDNPGLKKSSDTVEKTDGIPEVDEEEEGTETGGTLQDLVTEKVESSKPSENKDEK